MWSSSFFQSCYYFDPLLRSPFKALKRCVSGAATALPASRFCGLTAPGAGQPLSGAERRVIAEPYRQAFGRKRTNEFGRPAGWTLLLSAVEKIFFPTSLLIMVILEWWAALAVIVAAETAIGVAALFMVMKGRRLEYAAKALAVTPIRYALLGMEMLTIGRFITDLWLTNDRRWRK
jgi:hypothetical protein